MRIFRLSTFSLTLAVAVFALGYTNPAFAGKKCDADPEHKSCKPPAVDGITYTAALEGAFVFGPLSVTLEGQDARLKSGEDVTIVRPATGDPLNTWNQVFGFCGLLDQPVDEFTAPAGKKGWRISRPGGVYVLFRNFGPLPSTIGPLDLSLQLNGDCSYSSDGPIDCDAFPPEAGDTSRIPLTHFIIHATGEQGITHQIEGCHTITDTLFLPSTLVITATAPAP